jgi:hypothetical protein
MLGLLLMGEDAKHTQMHPIGMICHPLIAEANRPQ